MPAHLTCEEGILTDGVAVEWEPRPKFAVCLNTHAYCMFKLHRFGDLFSHQRLVRASAARCAIGHGRQRR